MADGLDDDYVMTIGSCLSARRIASMLMSGSGTNKRFSFDKGYAWIMKCGWSRSLRQREVLYSK